MFKRWNDTQNDYIRKVLFRLFVFLYRPIFKSCYIERDKFREMGRNVCLMILSKFMKAIKKKMGELKLGYRTKLDAWKV